MKVEWKKLWEVTMWDKKFNGVDKHMQPKTINYPYVLANHFKEIETEKGNVRLLSTGDYIGWTTEKLAGMNLCEGEIVAIPWGGYANIKYYKGKFVTADNRIATTSNEEQLITKYLYYYFCENQDAINNFYRGAGIKHPSMRDLLCMDIPLPKKEAQQQIVNQLDAFTSLIASLESELDLRKKQFEHYRNKLYGNTLEELKELSKKGLATITTLSEIGTFQRGRRFVRTDIKDVGIPCIHYGDMYTYYGTKAYCTPTFLDENFSKKLRYAENNDVVIVGAGENDIDIGIGVAWLGKKKAAVHDACYIYSHKENPIYIAHYLRTNIYHQQIKKYVSSGKICSIPADGIGKAIIPLPPLSAQQSIVEKLDAFEQLVVKLEEEIALRKKQYEYYREKLLTFE